MNYIKIFFNLTLTIVSFLIPKSPKYVIVGGWYGKRYADNSKAIYEYLNQCKEKIGLKRIFWYTNDKNIYRQLKTAGQDVLIGITPKSIFYHLRSKTHIIDQNPHDILGFLSVRCNRINLWHGFPLKKIGNLITGNSKKYSFVDKISSGGCWLDQYVLATSELCRDLLSEAMGIRKENCIIASYPRTEILFSAYAKSRSKESFSVFYLPTLRGKKERNPLLDADLLAINKAFHNNGITFQMKPHPASIGEWKSIDNLSNFKILNACEDVYNVLSNTDLLITDYSSVHFDYMLTGKALMFFPYDYTEYVTTDRGFNLPYDQYTPGDKVYTVEEMVAKILEIKNNYREYQKKYEKNYIFVNEQVNQYQEIPNYDSIIEILKN